MIMEKFYTSIRFSSSLNQFFKSGQPPEPEPEPELNFNSPTVTYRLWEHISWRVALVDIDKLMEICQEEYIFMFDPVQCIFYVSKMLVNLYMA